MATTEEALEAITDPGEFEKLATAVLRIANPTYSRLIHVGVNAQGKTVKSPIDGIVVLSSSKKVVATAYTAIALRSLRAKWLGSIEGDVPKGIAELSVIRGSNPNQSAALVLVTNREPDTDLMNEVGDRCAAAGIELDLWERSRLAGFLDHNPEGQWLRQRILRVAAERLSNELMLQLSIASRDQYAKRIFRNPALVARCDEIVLGDRIALPGITVLSAPSGFGKSALALRLMNASIAQELPTVWIPESVVEQEAFLATAVHRVLEGLHGSALSLGPTHPPGSAPLLVVIDDVTATHAPGSVLEKVVTWSRGRDGTTGTPSEEANFHLLVPIRPDVPLALREDFARELAGLTIEMRPLELDEAIAVYKARTGDHVSTDDEVSRMVEQLGRDPLLIDLHDRGKSTDTPDEIVRAWIMRQLAVLSRDTGFPVAHYATILSALGMVMLQSRLMAPSAVELERLFSHQATQWTGLAAILRDGSILRWEQALGVERLGFRHDRIRDSILADAMGQLLDVRQADEPVGDPYYTELIAESLVRKNLEERCLSVAAEYSPLALFAALRRVGHAKQPSNQRLVSTIRTLLVRQNQNRTLPDVFFWAAQQLLADTDAPEVSELLGLTGGSTHWLQEGLVRNGHVAAAIGYVQLHSLETTYVHRDRLIIHAADRHPGFVLEIAALLARPDLPAGILRALLLLAGFSKRSDLANSIETCVVSMSLEGSSDVQSALWAVTQCCRDNLEKLVDLVIAAFSRLSAERPDNAHQSERECALLDLGGRRIAEDLPTRVVPIILDQWQIRPEIRDELNLFLQRVDDPRALQHFIRSRAQRIRADAASGQSGWGYAFLADEWRLDSARPRRMSVESRQALLKIWRSEDEPQEDRLVSFAMWRVQACGADLPILRVAVTDERLRDQVLQARVSLGDRSASDEFLARVASLEARSLSFWWQFARGVMNHDLAAGLEGDLERHRASMAGDPGWIVSELIMELPPQVAEKLLVTNWGSLQDIPMFVQAALFVNTEVTRELVRQVFEHSTSPEHLLDHLPTHFGIGVSGRSERVTIEHLEAVVPYLGYMTERALVSLWVACNRRRWFAWRRDNLDARLGTGQEAPKFDIASREALLDSLGQGRPIWPDWVKSSFLDLGYTPDEAFTAVTGWVAKRATPRALNVAATLFLNEASRAHLYLFDNMISGNAAYTKQQVQVHFGVKYRTLS